MGSDLAGWRGIHFLLVTFSAVFTTVGLAISWTGEQISVAQYDEFYIYQAVGLAYLIITSVISIHRK